MSTNIKKLLSDAERFIAGFEDDPDQKGVVKLLAQLREAIAAPVPRLVVTLDGGLVQDIYADTELRAVIIDYDVEDSDPDDLTVIPDTDEDKQADVRKPVVDVSPARIDVMLANVEE